MESLFNSEYFAGNRARLRALFTGTAPIVLAANGLLQKSADTTYPFRQDSTFWYFTGLDVPNLILVLDKNKEYLIVPDKEEVWEIFDGPHNLEYMATRSGIAAIYTEKQGWKELKSRLKKVKHVATLAPLPTYVDSYGFFANPARARLQQQMLEINPHVDFLDLREHVARLRMVKQLPELRAINSAIRLTAKSLSKVHKKLGTLKNEADAQILIDHHFNSHHAEHAYDPIIASGKNACTIHYTSNNQAINQNDFLLLDVGAQIEYFAADITRTYAVGTLSKRQQAVFEAVGEVHEFACKLLRPKITLREYEAQVQAFMGEKLRELGLIRTIEPEQIRKYYPHATSHFLGLDVHDVGDYDRPLEPGVVLTVEPGIYIPEEGIGIRLEDDILITKRGHKNLSASIPVR